MVRLATLALLLVTVAVLVLAEAGSAAQKDADLEAGFSETEITPAIKADKPVYMAGFGHNRKATAVHDPLRAMAVVLAYGEKKIALVSVDLVGFFLPNVQRVRKELP